MRCEATVCGSSVSPLRRSTADVGGARAGLRPPGPPRSRRRRDLGLGTGRRWATADCRSSICRPPGPSRWSTPSSGWPSSSTAASTTIRRCATSSSPRGHRFFSHSDTEVMPRPTANGAPRCVDAFQRHVRLRRGRTRQRPTGPRPGPARDKAALPRRHRRARCGSPPPFPPCSPWGAPTVDRPRRPGLLHDLPLGGPAAADDPARACASFHRRPSGWWSPTVAPDDRLLGPAFARDPARADWDEALAGRAHRRRCAGGESAGWWPTCRSACCSPGASTRP